MSDFDSPWKEALESFFPFFLAFFFPRVHAAVDWSRGYEALDKELQQIAREAAVGRRYADKLFKVWLRDGQEAWVLIHVEVQSQRDEEFTERMFVYHYRLYDRYRRPVVSLALLADDQPGWSAPTKGGICHAASSVHADRAAGGHCHHCRADRPVATGGTEGARGGQPHVLWQ